ncbi:hypothetical protein Pan181_45590 [Aeoliella mucimassa]|uniref:Uncharacterized protein n=1 Tax=Aeoliella mucimassa TaxID=2527972 RepID=A0A518AUE9_9BACT|nr:hypothetical protein Pan181_45590 [Aeoliella mucimassa]
MATKAPVLTIRCDRDFRERLRLRAERVGVSVQKMTHSVLNDLLEGRLCIVNPLGEVIRFDAEGRKPRKVATLTDSGVGQGVATPPISCPR